MCTFKSVSRFSIPFLNCSVLLSDLHHATKSCTYLGAHVSPHERWEQSVTASTHRETSATHSEKLTYNMEMSQPLNSHLQQKVATSNSDGPWTMDHAMAKEQYSRVQSVLLTQGFSKWMPAIHLKARGQAERASEYCWCWDIWPFIIQYQEKVLTCYCWATGCSRNNKKRDCKIWEKKETSYARVSLTSHL